MTCYTKNISSLHQNDAPSCGTCHRVKMPKEFIWLPDSDGGHGDELRVNALPAFNLPISVIASRTEMRGIIKRLNAEPKEKKIALSNDLFKKGLTFDPADKDTASEEFERFCGDAVVFYCIRFVLDGRGVPCIDDDVKEEAAQARSQMEEGPCTE